MTRGDGDTIILRPSCRMALAGLAMTGMFVVISLHTVTSMRHPDTCWARIHILTVMAALAAMVMFAGRMIPGFVELRVEQTGFTTRAGFKKLSYSWTEISGEFWAPCWFPIVLFRVIKPGDGRDRLFSRKARNGIHYFPGTFSAGPENLSDIMNVRLRAARENPISPPEAELSAV